MKFGKEIKRIRENRLYTLYQMEEKTGISKPELIEIESGQKNPTKEQIHAIADALAVPLPIITYLSIELAEIQPDKVEAYKEIDGKMRRFIDSLIMIKE